MAVEALRLPSGPVARWCTGTLQELRTDGTVATSFSLREANAAASAAISGFQAKASCPTAAQSSRSETPRTLNTAKLHIARRHDASRCSPCSSTISFVGVLRSALDLLEMHAHWIIIVPLYILIAAT